MKADVIKYLKIAWETIGKPSTQKAINTKTVSYIHDICSKYDMPSKYEEQIIKESSILVEYIVSAKLNNRRLDYSKIKKHIKGPLTQALLKGLASINHPDNMLAELTTLVDETDIDNIRNFFVGIGMPEMGECMTMIQEALTEIKEGKLTKESEFANNEQHDTSLYVQGVPTERSVAQINNMTDEEEELFIKNYPQRFYNKSCKTPAEVADLIKTFIEANNDAAKFIQMQKTKRAEIRAKTAERIREIDAMRDVIMVYLNKTFDERNKIFSKYFECVDKALADGDVQLLAISLSNITELAKSSPFKALSDINNVQKQLTSENTIFDI